MPTYWYLGSEDGDGVIQHALRTPPECVLPMESGSGDTPEDQFFAHLTTLRMARLWFGPRLWVISGGFHQSATGSYDEHMVSWTGQMSHPAATELGLSELAEATFVDDDTSATMDGDDIEIATRFELCRDRDDTGTGSRYFFDEETGLWTPRIAVQMSGFNAASIVTSFTNMPASPDAVAVVGKIKIPTPTSLTDATAPWTLTEHDMTLRVNLQEGVDPDALDVAGFDFTIQPGAVAQSWWAWQRSDGSDLYDTATGNVRPGRSPLETNL
jgi:hypothetical protein